jgi:hypothetical protein
VGANCEHACKYKGAMRASIKEQTKVGMSIAHSYTPGESDQEQMYCKATPMHKELACAYTAVLSSVRNTKPRDAGGSRKE